MMRRCRSGGIALALAAGLAAPALGEQPMHAPRQVLAFYYGWYGNPRVSGRWEHWKPAADGARATNITDTPYDGLYDSHDPAELAREAALARDAGITGFIADWWGQGDFTDQSMGPLLAAAHRSGLAVTAIVDKNLEGAIEQARAAQAANDILYLLRRYGADPAWLKVEGKPVLFIYDRAAVGLGLPAWHGVLATVRAQVPGAVVLGPKYDPDWLRVFDGADEYNITGAIHALSPLGVAEWAVEHYRGQVAMAKAAGERIACATVIPGYDDSRTGRPGPRPITARDQGGTYAALWQAAIAAHPDWVLVTSWNEWHEGSEIEPSAEYRDLFLRITRRFASEFLADPGGQRIR
jgi:glycoprotein endo-alpha-1,2-mannosidase